MKALKRTQLIPKECSANKEIRYTRCGRTDKGVSALAQVNSKLKKINTKSKKGNFIRSEIAAKERVFK